MFVVGGIGTASSWFLMKPFGRRDIYIVGQIILCAIMLITAILGTVDRESQGAQWGIGALLIIFTFTVSRSTVVDSWTFADGPDSTTSPSAPSATRWSPRLDPLDCAPRPSSSHETCTTLEVLSSVSSTRTCSTPLPGIGVPSLVTSGPERELPSVIVTISQTQY